MQNYKESLFIMLRPYLILAFLWGYICNINDQFSNSKVTSLFFTCVIATIIVFIFSYRQRYVAIFDPFWFMSPYGILYYALKFTSINSLVIAILIPIILYNIKQFYCYFLFWPGLKHEDFRLNDFKNIIKNHYGYWAFCFINFHIMPMLMAFGGMLPVFSVLINGPQLNLILILGVVMSICGVIIEHVADQQLYPWRIKKSTKCIDYGLWRYSRHPNYFGDCLYWWGLFVIGLSQGFNILNILGVIMIQSVFLFYSIPAMEKHLLESRPSYKQYQNEVSMFIPWFRFKKD